MPSTSQCNDHSILSVPLLKPMPPNGGGAASLSFAEARSILAIALPMAATGLLLYSRSMVSMFFLGRLGRLPLAGGALALSFANITGYSVLSGLAAGMEPICGQAFGARRNSSLPALALRRTVLLLLAASLPIALLWSRIRPILLLFGQDPDISRSAESFLLSSLPDLLLHSLLHPLRVFLRTQSITAPLILSAAVALLLHLPINYLLVSHLRLGVPGVALASLWSNFNLVALLLAYVSLTGIYQKRGGDDDHLPDVGWASLLNLALPSCVSVCLEWWWYEIMILLCGLLLDPKSTVASMGILIQTTSLIYIFPSSLSFGVSTRVGNELGANRPKRARRAAVVGLTCGLAAGLAAAAFAAAVRNMWAGVFTSDARIAGLTASVLPVLGLCELGNCPQTTGCGILRGSARPRAGANINLGSFYGVGMPVAVGLAFWGGLDFRGLWLGLLAAQATCAVLMLGVVRRTDWDEQAERARQMTGGAATVASDEVDGEKEPSKSRAVDGDEKDSSWTSIKIQTD